MAGHPQHVGRHRSQAGRSARRAAWLVAGVAAAAVAVGAVVVSGGRSAPPSPALSVTSPLASGTASREARAVGPSTSTAAAVPGATAAAGAPSPRGACPSTAVSIAVAPELAPAIRRVLTAATTCPVRIVAVDPAAFVAAGASGAQGFDGWLPDSSWWAGRAAAAGIPTTPAVRSTATSPVLYAVARPAGQIAQPSPTMAELAAGTGAGPQIRVAVPDPDRSARSVAGLLILQTGLSPTAAATALTAAVHSSPAGAPVDGADLLQYAAAHPGVAVPASDQDITAFGVSHPAAALVRVSASGMPYRLDYPLLTLAGPKGRRTSLGAVVAALSTPTARATLAADGFSPPLSAAGGRVPTQADAAGISGDVQLIEKPTRTLALIDISGSMAQQVPGGGGRTRLDYARTAATLGLQQFSPDSDIGLWVFSRHLTAALDYRQLVAIHPLGDADGRQALAAALGGVEVDPDGGTGLYDSILAAVREVRSGWDPQRFNSVLVLSDGQNDDRGSIGLDELTSTLSAEQGSRPVPVIGIAFGPDSDVQALQRISAATGGATYVARDPDQISQIFLEAVGHRIAADHR